MVLDLALTAKKRWPQFGCLLPQQSSLYYIWHLTAHFSLKIHSTAPYTHYHHGYHALFCRDPELCWTTNVLMVFFILLFLVYSLIYLSHISHFVCLCKFITASLQSFLILVHLMMEFFIFRFGLKISRKTFIRKFKRNFHITGVVIMGNQEIITS